MGIMNEKDKTLTYASQIIGGDIEISRAGFESLQQRIVTALTTVRKEARAAAFKDAARIAGDFKRLDQDSLWQLYKTLTLEVALTQAAANTEEGGGDG